MRRRNFGHLLQVARPSVTVSRRGFITGSALAAPMLLSGCDALGRAPSFREMVLTAGEALSYRVQRLIGGDALAPEYDAADLSPDFRTNGNTQPRDPEYQRMQQDGFTDWRLQVGGLVERTQTYSLADLRAKTARTQITRHDCVEGWSAIGQWTGVPLKTLLDEVGLRPEAKFIVFRCADTFGFSNYYESIDLVDAFHPQTILAYGMNGDDLPVGHGAPIRLRVERQLGYKHAKFIMAIEATDSLAGIGQGRGGYWEDEVFYDWYAGI